MTSSQGKEIKFIDELNEEAFKIILDYAYSGILIINTDKIVTKINKWACDFFEMPMEDMLYRDTTEVFPNSELAKILVSEEVQKNKITVRNNKKIIISRTPLYRNRQLIGAIAVFNEYASHPNSSEAYSISSLLVDKGLVAKYHFDDIVYNSDAINYTISLAKTYSKTSSTILVTGESGTGKELFAQSIHNASNRKNKPFVALNCATLSESILESELFGYSDASFTGAKKGGKVGLFQIANGGTLFLDEIGEIPLSFQAKFLRALQEKQIRPVGSDKIIPIDVRIIAATNKNLLEEVKHDRFRLDLLYRINVLTLSIPPLRDRKEDIFDIAFHYFNQNNPAIYTNHKKLINSILQALTNYKFPGNVRELENILERLYLLISEGLLKENIKDILGQLIDYSDFDIVSGSEVDVSQSLENQEKQQIIDLLLKTKGSKPAVAKLLGISQSTLWRKMKNYGIK